MSVASCSARHHVSQLQRRALGTSLGRWRTRHERRAIEAKVKQTQTSESLDEAYILANGLIDYYSLLNVDDTASFQEIKAAYRALAKVCHVDIAGDEAHNTCILLNEAYEVLSNPDRRSLYNKDLDEALQLEDDGFTGQPQSKWCANTKMGRNEDPNESRAAFVDEISCIGCRECIYAAAATFRMEEAYGRSRVFAQWVNSEDAIQTAMDCCPVSCIHWVERDQLPALEFVVQRLKRPTVAVMMSNQGGYVPDVFAETQRYLKERAAMEEKRQRAASAARRSAATEEARREAAAELQRKQMGWFASVANKVGLGSVADSILESMDEVAGTSLSSAYSSSDDEYAYYKKVGRRRRAQRWEEGRFGARGQNGGRVPPERALVPVAATAQRQPWRRG